MQQYKEVGGNIKLGHDASLEMQQRTCGERERERDPHAAQHYGSAKSILWSINFLRLKTTKRERGGGRGGPQGDTCELPRGLRVYSLNNSW